MVYKKIRKLKVYEQSGYKYNVMKLTFGCLLNFILC